MDDPFARLKAAQREAWALFLSQAVYTTPPAAKLVAYAGLPPGSRVLDVACGTGVVAVTAARAGARVRGLDLTPVLLDAARENAATAGVDIEFTEGDAEALPYADHSFDAVLSQFGHMFAPRPEVATAEMLRVLKPGGRLAFSTWPPEQFFGRMFDMNARYLPPPAGVPPAKLWGDPNVIRERLGEAVTAVEFRYGEMVVPTLSPKHQRATMEQASAQLSKTLASLAADPEHLARFRAELEDLLGQFFGDNQMKYPFLMTRAVKK